MEPLHVTHINSGNDNYIGIEQPKWGTTWYEHLEFPCNIKKTFHKDWIWVEEIPQYSNRKFPVKPINHRFELVDPTIESDKFPATIPAVYNGEEYEWYIEDGFGHLKSLYKLVSDAQPDRIEKIDIIVDGTINAEFPTPISVPCQQDQIQYQLIDKIRLPGVLLQNRPCALSSQASYEIIRNYIKCHIDGRYARVNSDYDFCFSVKKVIQLAKLEPYEVDVNRGFVRRKPKYKTRYRNNREVEIFEMTHDKEKYREYTVLGGFKGNNLQDLQNNINGYLQNLIKTINEPITDCPHCSGRGVIIDGTIAHPE